MITVFNAVKVIGSTVVIVLIKTKMTSNVKYVYSNNDNDNRAHVCSNSNHKSYNILIS